MDNAKEQANSSLLKVQLTIVDISNDVLGDVNFDPNVPWAKALLATTATTAMTTTASSSFLSKLWGWGDKKGDVRRLAREALQHVCGPYEFYGSEKGTEAKNANDLVTGILRYVRLPDKYIALCSMLLKSQWGHVALGSHLTTQQEEQTHFLPVMDLPRTPHKKPFVPKIAAGDHKSNPQEDERFPFSVSHQYPYVALASMTLAATQRTALVGMDIVVFDLPSYYRQEDGNDDTAVKKFLEAFESSFTPREWGYIHATSGPPLWKLREFYLRWSMKEAYTKALGVGMGLEFDSFEVQLEQVDDKQRPGDEPPQHAIWPLVLSDLHSRDNDSTLVGSTFRCKVLRGLKSRHPSSSASLESRRMEEEEWEFAFVPLDGHIVEGENDDSTRLESNATSCACICGKFRGSKDGSARLSLTMERTTLADLVAWHRNGGNTEKSTNE